MCARQFNTTVLLHKRFSDVKIPRKSSAPKLFQYPYPLKKADQKEIELLKKNIGYLKKHGRKCCLLCDKNFPLL